MKYTTHQIARITNGKLIDLTLSKMPIEHLVYDSRKVVFPKSSVFFALVGKHRNGHAYIPQVYEAGVRCFVVSELMDLPQDAHIIRVADTLQALQILAADHRQQFSISIIGITGSNGKTIVKEWLYQLLHTAYKIVRSPKSYNSQIGVPLSVWQLNEQHELGIFEAGISLPNEMANLSRIIQCELGIFTNIGDAHSQGFEGERQKIREKLQLFKQAQMLIYRKENKTVEEEINRLNIPTFSWSTNVETKADLTITKIERGTIEAVFQSQNIQIQIPFSDAASIENAIHCWAMLLHLRIPQAQIEARMTQLEAVAMRLELKQGINACSIINDAFNSDVHSLEIALNFLEKQTQQERHTLILSDILQTGQEKEMLYKKVAELINAKLIHRFIGVGTAVRTLNKYLSPQIEQSYFENTAALLAQKLEFRNEAILLKGARKYAFERIAERLAQKVHRTTLEVNLNALVNNLKVYQSYLQPTTKTMVMVKANAYGCGSLEVARLLELQKVDYLAVAYADEGKELREGGITRPIMVLNPEEVVFESLIAYQLEPEIYTLDLLHQFGAYTATQTGTFPIHLKLDTGMRRLGFEVHQMEALLEALAEYPHLKVKSIFSHLAASEDEEEQAFTLTQIERFQNMYHTIVSAIHYQPLRHILNSSGIHHYAQHQMDMVRLGIGLYGVDDEPHIQQQLETVLTLKATISQLKHLKAGETIGYGRNGKATKDTTIATISIGYADGLLRLAGNGRFSALINGQLAPTIGNICMDMCMLEVSHIPTVKEGDEVLIFGNAPNVMQLATALQTIPYEIFTNISERVKRIYVQE